MQAALGPLTAAGTAVETPKQEVLEQAESIGGEFGSLFPFIGSFAIIAGVMLLVNVFVMLAEERKLRAGHAAGGGACGAGGWSAASSSRVPSTPWSPPRSAWSPGSASARPWSRSRPAFAGFAPEDGGLDLVYTVTPTSLINGFAAGFLIGFLTVALTSIRISRINIIAAIRDLPAEAGRPQVALGAGLDPGRGRVRGRRGGRYRRQPGRRHLPVPGPGRGRPLPAAGPPAAEAGRVQRGVAGRARLGAGRQHGPPKVFDDGSTATFIVLGVVLTSAVLLVSQNQELLLRLVRPLPGRRAASGLAARLAVAYLVARALPAPARR